VNLTIIIPTLGRAGLLLRLIGYYHSVGFKGKIVIGDGSAMADYEKANAALRPYGDHLRVCHLHLPGSSVSDAVHAANAHADTEYVCLVGDDDFIVPRTAAACIRFLETHTDYVAAHGLGVLVGAKDGRPQAVEHAHFYPQTIREETSAKDRLIAHLNNYSVSLFSVHRTDTWRRMFSAANDASDGTRCEDKTFSAELLPCCLSVSLGKIGQVEGLYLVRQVHGKRYILPDWFCWLSGEKWQPSLIHFRTQLGKAIAELDNSSLADALLVVDSGFSAYLQHFVSRNNKSSVGGLRNALAKIPYARWGWRRINALNPVASSGQSISYVGLTRPSSPYFRDFQAVLDVICQDTDSDR
jgi:glycosyltransferase domain-containing protein